MAVNTETTVRKILSLPREVWERVQDYRFANRIGTESQALRTLVEEGLKSAKIGTRRKSS